MASLAIRLLGPLQVTINGEPVTEFYSDKVRAFLAYLAAESGHPHRREALAGLLWPEYPERSARQSLSQALFALRKALGEGGTSHVGEGAAPLVTATREAIHLNATGDCWVDATEFTALLDACQKHDHLSLEACQACAERLQQAVGLYEGGFLAGFSLGDSAEFEEWLLVRRERYRRLAVEALRALSAHCGQRGEHRQALAHAQRWVELEPLDEEGHRQIMRLLALSDQRSAALAQYETCRRALREELGVEPAPETIALYESVREDKLVATRAAEFLPQPAPVFPPVEEPAEVARPLFVARERELAQLSGWLESALAGQGRVGFIVGEPGSGKTMLMQEFARRAMESHGGLLVARGSCNAYSGLGDPYLPFLEILQMLTGDVQSRLAGGAISREHGRRLWGALPTAVQALVQVGPELIDLLVPGEGLLARAQAFAPSGSPWCARLVELLKRKAASPTPAGPHQSDLFEQVTHVLQALAREHPLLLILDDLQWADAGSISLFFHLGRRLAGSRILVLGAYRPEEVALGRGGEQHPLEPVINEFRGALGESLVDLAQAEGRRFVDALIDSQPNRLGAAFRETLYRHTGGQALFTVELWRGLQERGDLRRDAEARWVEGPGLDWEQLPTRVEAVIAQHITRLPREWQELLTVASVEGEEFTAEVLARVQGEQEEGVIHTLSRALSREHRLVQALTLRRLGEQRLSGYRFRHCLFQSYLYQRLDEVQRARLHEEVANALEALHGATPRSAVEDYYRGAASRWDMLLAGQRAGVTAVAGQLARHFQAAGLMAKAVSYLQQAGERALSFVAHQEAFAHFNKALELLSTMPETPARARAEFNLQAGLILVLDGLRGLASPERGHVIARAYELAQQLGDALPLGSALYHLHWFHLHRGEVRLAMRLTQQIIDLTERKLPRYLPDVHLCLAADLYTCGDFPAARECLEGLLVPNAPPFSGDHEYSARTYLAFTRWYLGYPDQALQISQRNLSLAYETEDLETITNVLGECGAVFHQLRCELHATLEGAQHLLSHTSEGKWPLRWAKGMVLKGWADAHGEQAARAITEMCQGLAVWRATGEAARVPHWLALLAEGYALAGQPDEGLRAIAEALEQVERTDECFYEAELHRLRGELLWQKVKGTAEYRSVDEGGRAGPARSEGMRDDKEPSAEECFLKAIEVARRQEAKSWELRATMSLARLWQSQGKREDAREKLAAVYGWFTEGFGTPDLQDAKALLEQLSRG